MKRWSVQSKLSVGRLPALLAITALVLGAVNFAPSASQAAVATFSVMNTSESPPDGVWFRNGPQQGNTNRETGFGVYAGESMSVDCYSWGDAVGKYNNHIWYRGLDVSRPTVNGHANYGWMNTHYINDGMSADHVHPSVPDCSAPASTPAVSLSQGPAAPAGYRYSISLRGFAANTAVGITCYDSTSPGGFYIFSLTTNGSGAASTAAWCYSGNGPDHWVIAGGVASNHVTWGAGSTVGGTPGGGGGTGGGSTGGSSTTGYTPTHIKLNRSAGTRERNLLALASDLDIAASGAGVPGQTVAHIIYHEGGRYLGSAAQKTAWQQVELQGSGSVGIGQVKIATAKLVALSIYRDFETVNDDDIVVRANLIFDTSYSLKYSAGYVKMMQQAGISGDFQLFMAYAISVNAAKIWKSKSYSMNPATLSSIGIDPKIFKNRKVKYDQAVKAIS